MATTATKSELEQSSGKTSRPGSTSGAVSGAADAVLDAAADAASRLPDLVTTTRAALGNADRRIQAGTDEMLTIGTVTAFGFAVGLLIGGAGRLLVAAALVPVAMMGFALLDRSSAGRVATGRRQA